MLCEKNLCDCTTINNAKTFEKFNSHGIGTARCEVLPDDHEFISIGAYSKLSPDASSDAK